NSRLVGQGHKFAVHTDVGIVADFQVQVGGFALHGNAKQIINMHNAVLPQEAQAHRNADEDWRENTMLRFAKQSGFVLNSSFSATPNCPAKNFASATTPLPSRV